MHGTICSELNTYITNKFGFDVWQKIRTDCDLGSKIYITSQNYPDEEMIQIIKSLSAQTGKDEPWIMEDFGKFMAEYIVKFFGTLFEPQWGTLDLLENIPAVLSRVLSMYPEMSHPELNTTRVEPNVLDITYSSKLKMCALAKGVVKGFGEHYQENVFIVENSCIHNGDESCQISVTT